MGLFKGNFVCNGSFVKDESIYSWYFDNSNSEIPLKHLTIQPFNDKSTQTKYWASWLTALKLMNEKNDFSTTTAGSQGNIIYSAKKKKKF